MQNAVWQIAISKSLQAKNIRLLKWQVTCQFLEWVIKLQFSVER